MATEASDSTTLKLEVPKQTLERLEALRAKVEAPDIGGVTKNAWRLYESMVDEAEAGSEFFIKRKGSSDVEPYEVFNIK